jgi:hypothetical protein
MYNELFNTETNTTREAYLAWVAQWKAAYKTLSEDIRIKRNENKNLMRAGNCSYLRVWDLNAMSYRATQLLELRQIAKEEAAANRAKQLEEAANG